MHLIVGLKFARSKAIYEKTNRLTEMFCTFLHVFLNYAAVGFVLPKAIYSFFVYFCTGLDNDAFELPIPTWFVFLYFIVMIKN